jgi:hypothetical protein
MLRIMRLLRDEEVSNSGCEQSNLADPVKQMWMKFSLISAGRSYGRTTQGIRDIERKITFPDPTEQHDIMVEEAAKRRKKTRDVRFYELLR